MKGEMKEEKEQKFLKTAHKSTRLFYVLILLIIALGLVIAWYWLGYSISNEPMDTTNQQEEAIVVNDNFLYFSAVVPEFDDDIQVYELNLDTEIFRPVTSGTFHYDFSNPESDYMVVFGEYFQDVDLNETGQEVPVWFNMETIDPGNFEVPDGWLKRGMDTGGDFLSYQQSSNSSLVEENAEISDWEVVIYETSTNRHVKLEDFIQPQFITDDGMFILMLGQDGVYRYGLAEASVDKVLDIDFELSPNSQLQVDTDGFIAILGSDVYQIYKSDDLLADNFSLLHEIEGSYKSIVLSENDDLYYVISDNDDGVVNFEVESRNLQTGSLFDSFTLNGISSENISLDALLTESVLDKYIR